MEEDKKSSVKPVATIKTAAVRPEAQKVVPEVVTKKEEPKKAAVAETAKTVISGKVADVKSAMEKKQEVAEKTVAKKTAEVKKTVAKKEKAVKKAVVKKEKEVKKAVGKQEKTVEKAVARKEKEVKKAVTKKEKAVKKTVARKTTEVKKAVQEKLPVKKAEAKIKVVLQFGDRSVEADKIVETAQNKWKNEQKRSLKEMKSLDLYVKPEEGKVYYVANEKETGDFEI